MPLEFCWSAVLCSADMLHTITADIVQHQLFHRSACVSSPFLRGSKTDADRIAMIPAQNLC
jgi:hypothetical protein